MQNVRFVRKLGNRVALKIVRERGKESALVRLVLESFPNTTLDLVNNDEFHKILTMLFHFMFFSNIRGSRMTSSWPTA